MICYNIATPATVPLSAGMIAEYDYQVNAGLHIQCNYA